MWPKVKEALSWAECLFPILIVSVWFRVDEYLKRGWRR